MFEGLKQWAYPKEFRITNSGVSSGSGDFKLKEIMDKIENLMAQILENDNNDHDNQQTEDPDFIKDIANSIWKLEKRTEGITDDLLLTKLKGPLNIIKNKLESNEIEIRDYTGQRWGLLFEGMPFDDVKGDGEVIMMTEPCILWKGKFLQRGKIIRKNIRS